MQQVHHSVYCGYYLSIFWFKAGNKSNEYSGYYSINDLNIYRRITRHSTAYSTILTKQNITDHYKETIPWRIIISGKQHQRGPNQASSSASAWCALPLTLLSSTHSCFLAATYMGAKNAIKNNGMQINTNIVFTTAGNRILQRKYSTGSNMAEISIPRMAARLM